MIEGFMMGHKYDTNSNCRPPLLLLAPFFNPRRTFQTPLNQLFPKNDGGLFDKRPTIGRKTGLTKGFSMNLNKQMLKS
ncbi:MAG: hypothetical protein ACRCYZ_03920 [Alphaproteobacteria bacterium]